MQPREGARKIRQASSLIVVLAMLGTLVSCARLGGEGSAPEFTHLQRTSQLLPTEGLARVRVANLVGSVTVEGVDDATGIEIVAAFTGGGATQEEARRGAESLSVRATREGDRLAVTVDYPLDTTTSYLDPAIAQGGAVQIATASPEVERAEIEGRYEGRAVEVLRDPKKGAALLVADIVVRVPRTLEVEVEQLAGEIHAMKMDGELSLGLLSGEVQARRVTGDLSLSLDTGYVRVMDAEGRAKIETETSVVELVRYMGDMRISARQGVIELRESYASRLFVETESGSISLREVTGSVEARTDAAEIDAEYLRTSERFVASSDSGAVRVSGDFSAAREVSVSSGSGEVELGLSDSPPVAFHASTDSGSLDVDLPDLQVSSASAAEIIGMLGDIEGEIRVRSERGFVRIFQIESPTPAFRNRM